MVRRAEPPSPQLRSTEIAAVQTVADLAALLRRLRRREARRRDGAELTYRQLAARAGWSHAVVATYLTGKTLPSTDRFDVLIRLLGTSPAEQGALATARDRVDERRRRLPAGFTSSVGQPIPRQLPASVPGFVGRAGELAELDRLLELSRRRSTLGIAVVTGTAGVGKTAFALHWAHRAKSRFPDGQLYADLRGYAPQSPAPAAEILDAALAALGAPLTSTPAGLDAKAALFRSLLDGRRVLMVLDNAADSPQVRPLLPGAPGCLVVVTSRSNLTGLVARDRAHRISLDLLSLNEALTLLGGFVGAARITAEIAAARQLARLCACLPVALCAAGERAASRLTDLVTDLVTADNRLDLLQVADDRRAGVREVLSWSYQRLAPDSGRLFRLLGLHPGPDLDRYAAAALAGTDPDRVGELLEVLVSVNLLRQAPPDRYQLHDLLRAYAWECTRAQDPPESRRSALGRLLSYYRSATVAAVNTLHPQQRFRSARSPTVATAAMPVLTAPQQARAWLATERLNLLAATAHSARHGFARHASELASALSRHRRR